MGTRRGERSDVEQQVQRLLQPQRVVVSQGMSLAPLPAGRVVAEGIAQVRQGFAPGLLHRRIAITLFAAALFVPPG
ncbi:hypothetical protein D9M73_267290 [compost metagenome]